MRHSYLDATPSTRNSQWPSPGWGHPTPSASLFTSVASHASTAVVGQRSPGAIANPSQHVTSLTTLQDIIRNVRTDYIKQTNKLLGEDGATLDINTALSRIGDNLLLAPMPDLQPASTPAAVAAPADAAPDKKERKKRQHDPNAPKRPLTPFFLYMQTARPIIAGDLGPDVAKGAVSDEGTRRWKEMTLKDKTVRPADAMTLPLLICCSCGPAPTRTTSASTTPACTRTRRGTCKPRT
jgi:hypothetical protein